MEGAYEVRGRAPGGQKKRHLSLLILNVTLDMAHSKISTAFLRGGVARQGTHVTHQQKG